MNNIAKPYLAYNPGAIESNNYITSGGYASHIRVDTHFACQIPNGYTPEEVAPSMLPD